MRHHLLFRLAVLLAMLLHSPMGRAEDPALKSQLDVITNLTKSDVPNAFRILFIGDSITLHGTNTKVKAKLKWEIVAGMAASEPDKDYVHLFAKRMQDEMPDRKVEIYYHTLGGSGSIMQRLSAIDKVKPVEPHLVVVQLGEHEKSGDDLELLRTRYKALITTFAGASPRPLVLCTGPWSPHQYKGWAGQTQSAMQEVCGQHAIPFVSVEDLANDPRCSGSGETAGVRWHPNDKGHAGYAAKLFEAYMAAQKRTGSAR